MEQEKSRIKAFQKRKKDGEDNHRESDIYFLDNLDDPDIVFNKICFI